MTDNNQNRPDYYVSEREPEAKAPPALETGALKWIRENLFNSIANTILTIVGFLIVFYTLSGVTTWVVRDANWFSVSANINNFMLGRYEEEYQWRATLTLFFSVFVIGSAIAIWIRQISRTMLISIVAIILMVQVAPRLVNTSLELPSWYAGAGNVEIVIAQTTETAFDSIAFTGQEGDNISITYADEETVSEASLADLNGFVDNIANTIRNQAANRLTAIETVENFESLIAEDDEARANGDVPVLTQSQYEEYTAEVGSTTIGEPVLEIYNLNQIPVLVEIIDPETMEAIASVTLASADDVFEATLPHSGWFILNKTLVTEGAEFSEGLALLDVQGIYPSAKRETTNGLAFTRRPDGYTIENENPPRVDGSELPFIDIIRNQYRGDRPLNDYLRTYVAPFFLNIANYTSLVLLVGIAGYIFTDILRNTSGIKAASSFATYGLMSIPAVVWILINGIFLYSVMMWLLVAAMAIFSYALYKKAQKDGYTPALAVIGIAGYIALAVALVLSGDFDFGRLLTILPLMIEDASVPRFIAWLGIIFIPLALWSGKSAHIPGDEVDVNIPLLAGIAAVLFAVGLGTTATNMVSLDIPWALEPSDPRGWGGLLLTFMLTIYGIIIAFPIGIGLALGRRSDLPLIKYLCTAYIELVRGSPFITVLFFMQLFIPLINSDFNQIPGSYRAIAATIAFSAAYLAENVRGGLQSLPPGQDEAAKALGLNPWQSVSLITLPQALRAVIPALVGQFIGLFKDTSLVTIVGLIDLVGFVNAMVVQAEFIGTRLEGLLFISILYFVVSYVMSYISRLLEASGSGSTRRM
ncbi:MAG: hypothetical protein Phog2KO_38090 [Phototrophicaceae bacterium]